jgi:hypothetical protein
MKYLLFVLLLIVSCKSVDNNKSKELAFPETDSPISLVPIFLIENDMLVFRLAAKRNEIVEREYFPTSENLRIILKNEKGKVIYQSNKGMNYFQAIEDVKPIEINDTYIYELKTKKPDNFNKGKYKIYYMLPSKPFPYQTMLEYEKE